MEGTIKFYNKTKAYGFINIVQSPKEVFFHISSFGSKPSSELTKGDHVSFDIETDSKGERATNIQLI